MTTSRRRFLPATSCCFAMRWRRREWIRSSCCAWRGSTLRASSSPTPGCRPDRSMTCRGDAPADRPLGPRLRAGRLAKINTHDILGYGLISCRNLDHMLQLASRYYHLVNEVFTMTYGAGGSSARWCSALSPRCRWRPCASFSRRSPSRCTTMCRCCSGRRSPAMTSGCPCRRRRTTTATSGLRRALRVRRVGRARHQRADGRRAARQAAADVRSARGGPVEERCGPRVRPPGPGEQWGEFIVMMLREAQGQQLTLEALAHGSTSRRARWTAA